ncbi:class I SAM-dependent methyltransferase [Streptomyces sp. NPDC058284]|uniref:class I SAM-dependent methyltransferase n=1 Tax=unclassified Streptomyces TaxID=2593676 RepID=UPI003650C12C
MTDEPGAAPDSTAMRTALWRALHLQVDQPPHVVEDEVGLRLVAPDEAWRDRPDMDARATSAFRASVVVRARFVEDLIAEQAGLGVTQYVILGAGLDTFAQRKPDLASRLRVFEVDRSATQTWKRRRLVELGYGVPDWLHLVPVDFEAGASWSEELAAAGFDPARPAVVVSTGVSMYISKAGTTATLRQAAALAPGSTFAMTFLLPYDLADPAERPGLRTSEEGARRSGNPFVSSYTPREVLALALEAGFKDARHVAGVSLAQRYLADRTDGLHPSTGEDLLLAFT